MQDLKENDRGFASVAPDAIYIFFFHLYTLAHTYSPIQAFFFFLRIRWN